MTLARGYEETAHLMMNGVCFVSLARMFMMGIVVLGLIVKSVEKEVRLSRFIRANFMEMFL